MKLMKLNKETLTCSLHLVETTEETNIILHPSGIYEFIDNAQIAHTINSSVKGFIFVISSNEPIKIGDLSIDTKELKIKEYTKNTKVLNSINGNYRKIIGLTTTKTHSVDGFIYPQLSDSFIKEVISKDNKEIQVKFTKVKVEEDGIYCDFEEDGNDCNGCQGMCPWIQLYKPIVDTSNNLQIEIKANKKNKNKTLIIKALRDFRTECLPFGQISDYELNTFTDKWVKENIK